MAINGILSMQDKHFIQAPKPKCPYPAEKVEQLPPVGALSVACSSISDKEIAIINKVGLLPQYAKVVESEDGYKLKVALDYSDGEHIMPEGYQMKNDTEGKTYFDKIV